MSSCAGGQSGEFRVFELFESSNRLAYAVAVTTITRSSSNFG